MRVIEPSFVVEPVDGAGVLRRIEEAGRTCYKSEDHMTEDSAPHFIRSILTRGHESVLEHEKVTVRIVCDRGVTHEIVRHRIASYSQESTRYCNYGKAGVVTFIRPPWVRIPQTLKEREDITVVDLMSDSHTWGTQSTREWCRAMLVAEAAYLNLVSAGWSAQEARSVLHNSLKTEIVMTCNLREWRHFFRLRTAKAAHPQMRQIAIPLLRQLQRLIPVVFDDIEPFED